MIDMFLEKSTLMMLYIIPRVENVLNKFTSFQDDTRGFVVRDVEVRKTFGSKRVSSVVDNCDAKAFRSSSWFAHNDIVPMRIMQANRNKISELDVVVAVVISGGEEGEVGNRSGSER